MATKARSEPGHEVDQHGHGALFLFVATLGELAIFEVGHEPEDDHINSKMAMKLP